MQKIISFPGLGLELQFSNVAFYVFGKPIFWYGIIIGCGFLIASFYAFHRAPEFRLDVDKLLDLLLIATPICILCARIYYVIFEWQNQKDLWKGNFLELIAIWHGGIAIYGAVIGGIITVLLFCHFRKVNVYDVLDLGSLGMLIGQFIGRWGNFVNGEAFGGPTSLPWRMNIGQTLIEIENFGVHTGVHPTFFYESCWNFIGFLFLHQYAKHRKYKGEIFWLYVAWYGLGRSFIEGMRTDSLYIPGTPFRVSQLLAAGSFAVAFGILLYNYRTGKLLKRADIKDENDSGGQPEN